MQLHIADMCRPGGNFFGVLACLGHIHLSTLDPQEPTRCDIILTTTHQILPPVVLRVVDIRTRVVGPLPRKATVSDGFPLSDPLRRTVGEIWLLATARDAPVLPLRCPPEALCVQGQTGNGGAA